MVLYFQFDLLLFLSHLKIRLKTFHYLPTERFISISNESNSNFICSQIFLFDSLEFSIENKIYRSEEIGFTNKNWSIDSNKIAKTINQLIDGKRNTILILILCCYLPLSMERRWKWKQEEQYFPLFWNYSIERVCRCKFYVFYEYKLNFKI